MIRWTGLAPWKFEFPFPGSLTSTFLVAQVHVTLHLRAAAPAIAPPSRSGEEETLQEEEEAPYYVL